MGKYITIILVVIFVSGVNSFAQQSITYFSDTTHQSMRSRSNAVLTQGNYIYVGGQSFDTLSYKSTPTVSKYDTSGNLIWCYSLNKHMDPVDEEGRTLYYDGFVQNMFLDSSNVFVYIRQRDLELHIILCLDIVTGHVKWRRFTTGLFMFFNVNSETIGYTFNNDTHNFYELADKRTGIPIFTKTMSETGGAGLPSSYPALGADGTMFLIKSDSIFLYSSIFLTDRIWGIKVINEGYVMTIYDQGGGEVYVFGNFSGIFSERLFFTKINKANGSIVWQTKSGATNYDDQYISGIRFHQNSIFLSSNNRLSGASYSAYHLWKIDKTTGAINWRTYFNPYSIPYPLPGDYPAGVTSFTQDQQGNSYITGYERGEGIWGICKFNSSGQLVYHNPVYENGFIPSSNSRGMCAFMLNDRVFFVGNLQKDMVSGNVGVKIISSDTGAVFNGYRKNTVVQYQEFSSLKGIVKYKDSKYALFKQGGHSAVLELHNSADGSLIWSQTIERNFYTEADRICVTADQKILVSCLAKVNTYMQFDYRSRPAGVSFLKFDSTGSLLEEKAYSIYNSKNFKSVQLYASADTNAIYIYTQRDYYGHDGNLAYFNIDKATVPLGHSYNEVGTAYSPINARQYLMLPRSRDSAICAFKTDGIPFYKIYKFNLDRSSGCIAVLLKLIPDNIAVHNMATCDSSTVITVAKHLNGSAVLSRFNFRTMTVLWTNIENDAGLSIDAASCYSDRIYWAGRRKKELVIRKASASNASKIWETVLTFPDSLYYVPLDQKYNSFRHQYTVCGYIEDSSVNRKPRQAFYVTVDSSGNMVKYWKQPADLNHINQLEVVEITQFGQTLIGGSINTVSNGKSGILIEADSALAQPESFCVNGSGTIKSDINGNSYQWQINTGSGFQNIVDDTLFSGSNTNQINLARIPTSFYDYKFRCMVNGTMSSRVVTIRFSNAWTGLQNNSWEDPLNWSCGVIPDEHTDVVIQSGTIILNSNAVIRSLKINAGVNFQVNQPFNLTILH